MFSSKYEKFLYSLELWGNAQDNERRSWYIETIVEKPDHKNTILKIKKTI